MENLLNSHFINEEIGIVVLVFEIQDVLITLSPRPPKFIKCTC